MPGPAHHVPRAPTNRPVRRPSRPAAMLLAAALALAGCGGTDDAADEATDTAAQTSAPAPADPTTDASTEAATEATTDATTDMATEPTSDATVAVASSDLGDILVDADGMTLYVFDNDSEGVSACTDDCLANWPPLVAEDPVAGDGVDATLATFEREDTGDQQVTANGHPLYYWAGDSEPGDVSGHGVGDVWWATTPAGEAVAADAGTAAGASASSDDGNLAEGVEDGGY